MSLFVSTTGTDVSIPELGVVIVHPTIDRDLTSQFSSEEIRSAESLTTAIQSGVLAWKLNLSDSAQIPANYDQDAVSVVELSSGPGTSDTKLVRVEGTIADGILPAWDQATSKWVPRAAPAAINVPFDNTTNGFSPIATNVQKAIEEATGKQFRTLFVSTARGNDTTGSPESPTLPFKTIQAAINKALTLIPSPTNNYIVQVEQGSYPENVSMADYVTVVGRDMVTTIIEGTVTYGSNVAIYSELRTIQVSATNAPAAIFQPTTDTARCTITACSLNATYTQNLAVCDVIKTYRGSNFISNFCKINFNKTVNGGGTGGGAGQDQECIYSVLGSEEQQFESIGNIHSFTTVDQSDDLTLVYNNNTNANTYCRFKDGFIEFNQLTSGASNDFTLFYHLNARGYSSIDNNLIFVNLPVTNNMQIIGAYAYGSLSGGSELVLTYNSYVFKNEVPSRVYSGGAATATDTLRNFYTNYKTQTNYTPGIFGGTGGSYQYIISNSFGNLVCSGVLLTEDMDVAFTMLHMGG